MLPLPLKRNKLGEYITLSVIQQYHQLTEKVLAAHQESIIKRLNNYEAYEAEKLTDVIVECVTMIYYRYANKPNFEDTLQELFDVSKSNYETYSEVDDSNFYITLNFSVMNSFRFTTDIIRERYNLMDIIYLCVKHLESLGYNKVERNKLYEKVNEKILN